MTLTDQLTDYVHAAFSGLWIQTHEPDEAEREIVHHARQQHWNVAVWDIAQGLRLPQLADTASPGDGGRRPAGRPACPAGDWPNARARRCCCSTISPLPQQPRSDADQRSVSWSPASSSARFSWFYHRWYRSRSSWKSSSSCSNTACPTATQLERIARELTSDSPEDLPQGEELQGVLDAAAGLTRYEAEGAFALSLTRHNAIQPPCIWELKAQALKKNNLLTLHRGEERFDALGGLSNLKEFCRRALRPGTAVQPRGVLLLGPPGSGKSALAKALGNETGRPTLLLDFGALMASLVGQTEANLRQALRIADAMSPAILFVDEVEKALSGVGSTGDSGVSTRLFGTLLTWLSDHSSDVFFVATSNDISRLPPEFTRAERLDGVFFLDLPSATERDAIWQMYRRSSASPQGQIRPDDTSWTGAEIRSCCRLAALLDVTLTQAAHHVVPVSVTAAENVDRLRTWASGRCLNAAAPGIYRRDGEPPPRAARRLQRPGNN